MSGSSGRWKNDDPCEGEMASLAETQCPLTALWNPCGLKRLSTETWRLSSRKLCMDDSASTSSQRPPK